MNARRILPKPQRAAFTLIELLTVIAIIVILMSLLMTAIQGAKDQARRADASATVRNIVNACKSYANDYGKFPPVASGGNIYSFGDPGKGSFTNNNSDLFNVLRSISATVNSGYVLNKRQQKYFEGPKAKDLTNPRSGFTDGNGYAGSQPQGCLMDPWGTQYCVVLDATGNDEIAATDIQTFYSDLDIVRMSAISFSLGKDGIRGGKGYEGQYRKPGSSQAPDDILSWQ